MPHIETMGIQIEYDTFGKPTDRPLVLIMGFALQMIAWDTRLCEMLAEKGFYVIRFDNRDVGLSSKMNQSAPVDLAAAYGGDPRAAPYSLDDMAVDVVFFLDALKISSAHIVGASMGGMIAQILAIKHPNCVRSLCSIMSTTGDRSVGQPTPDAIRALVAPVVPERDSVIENAVNLWSVLGSPGFPRDEAGIRERAGNAYDRCYYPAGVTRQFAALLTQRDRTADLSGVSVPSLVIHGSADPLIAPSGGEATARAIPGATHLVIEGMGHDLPEPAWPQIVDAINTNARKIRPQAFG